MKKSRLEAAKLPSSEAEKHESAESPENLEALTTGSAGRMSTPQKVNCLMIA